MLTLKHLNKRYADGTQALKNISVTFPTGMVGLLGPNGAGKSTLMRTIAGLQQPDSGSIQFADIDVLATPQALRQQLGYLPQHFGVYPNMSCRALLEHIAVLKGLTKPARREQIESLLALTNLTKHAKKRVSTFSGGMRQRFGIAQALLGDPKLIIMDEPTAGLDPLERENLNNLLVSISQQRLLLLSTHIVEDIESLCQHVAIMHQGEFQQFADVGTLIAPLTQRVWQLDALPDELQDIIVLSKTFRHGHSVFRVFSEQAPCAQAQPAVATLQDAYFLSLHQAGGQHVAG